jgi:hypothetical protein
VHLLVSEQLWRTRMHGATIKILVLIVCFNLTNFTYQIFRYFDPEMSVIFTSYVGQLGSCGQYSVENNTVKNLMICILRQILLG